MKVANLPKKIQIDSNNTSVKESSTDSRKSVKKTFLHFIDNKKLICILTISIELGISEAIRPLLFLKLSHTNKIATRNIIIPLLFY